MKILKILIAFISILFVLFCIFFSCYVSNYNEAVSYETSIDANYKDMENILAQYSVKVKETAHIPGMMSSDLRKTILAGMTGRYGKNGSKATLQWIKENYPGKIDPSIYKQIQNVIESGRNKFENAQTRLIDIKRVYQNKLNFVVSGFFLRLAGFPKIDLNKYNIISSEHAIDAFKTGISKPVI